MKPAKPELLSVSKVSGGLHVTWKLNDTGLSAVELWQKKNMGSYAKLVSVGGTETSYHDASANMAATTYCYHVMTLKGTAMSDMSNEICAMP